MPDHPSAPPHDHPPRSAAAGGGAASRVWRSLSDLAALDGWGLALLYLLHRLLGALRAGRVVPYALVAQPIGGGAYAAVRDDPSTTVRAIDAADPLAPALPRPAEVNQRRWAAGGQCLACSVKGRFAGTIWIQRGHYDEDEVRCRYRLPEDGRAVWDYDVYVEPALRMGRTMGRMWKQVDARLAADGVHWSFSRISLFNADSLRSHARLGARRVGRVVFVALGPLQLAWGDALPGGIHLSLPQGRPASIQLKPPAARAPAPQAPP